MKMRYATLSTEERHLFKIIYAFLRTRLREKNTVDWALKLVEKDRVKKIALLSLIDDQLTLKKFIFILFMTRCS